MKTLISKWPCVYSRKNKGGSISFIVDLGKTGNRKRDRHFFKTKAEADAFAESARIKRENDGVAMFSLPREFWVVAQKASEILRPFNASILEAANYYIAHLGKYQAAPTIKDAIVGLIAEMEANNRRKRTIRDTKNRLGHFAKDFGTKRLSEITHQEIKRWVTNPLWKARTRINYLTKLSQLFNFGIREGYVEKNIVSLIKRPTPEETKTEILTVEQAQQLLKHANQFGLLPYVAIGLFAGLRSKELLRLSPAAIGVEDGIVTVNGDVAKKRTTRHVTMSETLRAWLATCPPFESDKIVGDGFAKKFTALRKAAGITKWPFNALRHSFGSYHLAKHGDAKSTAHEMGNTEGIVHNHYKALVRRGDAERFWASLPEKIIVPLEQSKIATEMEEPKQIYLAQ